jgi:hypothetical protein
MSQHQLTPTLGFSQKQKPHQLTIANFNKNKLVSSTNAFFFLIKTNMTDVHITNNLVVFDMIKSYLMLSKIMCPFLSYNHLMYVYILTKIQLKNNIKVNFCSGDQNAPLIQISTWDIWI